jgi:hypothetical protein
MTAAELFAAMRPYGLAVEDGGLAYDEDVPADLERALDMALHTGVRALVSRLPWWGSTTADGKRPRVVELDPTNPIPPRINLLCVAGDERWDRIHPHARLDVPAAFQ